MRSGRAFHAGARFFMDSLILFVEDNLSFSSGEIISHAFHDLFKYCASTAVRTRHGGRLCWGTTVPLACMDAYPATVVKYFSEDGTDKAGFYWKTCYHDFFLSFIPVGYNQLIGCIRRFIQVWCAEELSTCFLIILDVVISNETSRTVLLKIYIFSLKIKTHYCVLHVI